MRKTFEAIYEDGVLRPVESVALSNYQHVQVTIADIADPHADVADYFDPEEWEASKQDEISLSEVQQALSSIHGCLSDTVISAREERF
jgi:predicted DNA-binding antitoxin AbrB/MazE fold protein